MILAAYLSLLVFGLLDNFRGPFFTSIIETFQLTETRGALVFALTSIAASLSSFRGGSLLRRFGVRGLMNFSSVCMGSGFFVMGISPNFPVLVVGAVFLGMGLGFATLAQNVAVAEYAPIASRARAMSGLHSMYALSSTLSPWLAHAFLVQQVGWRQSFMLVSLFPLSLALFSQFILRPKALSHEAPALKRHPWTLAHRGHIMLVAVASAFYLCAEISIGTRWVRWWEVVKGGVASDGALELMSFFIALLVGRLIAWKWSPHGEVNLRRCLLGSLIVGSLSLSLALWWHPRMIVICGFVLGPFYPMLMAYARLRFQNLSSQAFTLIFGTGSAGVVTMHFVIGGVSEIWGMQWAMQIGPVGLAVAFILLLRERSLKFHSVQTDSYHDF